MRDIICDRVGSTPETSGSAENGPSGQGGAGHGRRTRHRAGHRGGACAVRSRRRRGRHQPRTRPRRPAAAIAGPGRQVARPAGRRHQPGVGRRGRRLDHRGVRADRHPWSTTRGLSPPRGWEERDEFTWDDWDQIFEVNVKGIVRVTNAVDRAHEATALRPDRQHGVRGRQGRDRDERALQRVQVGRHHPHAGPGALAGALRHHRQLDLPQPALDAHVGAHLDALDARPQVRGPDAEADIRPAW